MVSVCTGLRPIMVKQIKIALIAGEPSGDQLGAWLMASLLKMAQANNNEIEFIGVGGPLMQGMGLTSTVPIADLAVNGVTDVIAKIPKLKRHIKNTVQFVKDQKPDALVTIDAPGFCFRVAQQLTDCGFPLVHYVAPTVWAWKPKRAKKIAAFLDHLLVLLPFEPKYFDIEGLATTFIGHPVRRQAKQGVPQRFYEKHGLSANKPILLILPGSRAGEVQKLLPVFEQCLKLIDAEVLGQYQLVVPTVDNVAHLVEGFGKDQGWNVRVVNDPKGKWDVMTAGTVALAASGTVSLELAAAGVATLVGYKASWLTTYIAKRVVKVKYASLINILADKEIQPEFLAEHCIPENMAMTLEEMLITPERRAAQLALVHEQLAKLQADEFDASDLAARQVFKLSIG